MILSLSNQAYLFLTSVYLGIAIFVFYDFFRAYRRNKRINKRCSNTQVHIQDLIYILTITIYAFYIYLYQSNGAIRFYYFIGMGLGAIIYCLTISKYVVMVFSKLINLTTQAFKKCIKICIMPIKMIVKLTKPYVKVYSGKAVRKVRKSQKYINRPKKYIKSKQKSFKRMIKVIMKKV